MPLSLIYKAVVADFGGFADDNARTVVNEKSLADLCARVNFYSREKSCCLRDYSCGKIKLLFVKLVSHSVRENSVKSRVGENYLECASCGRVAPLYRFNFFVKLLFKIFKINYHNKIQLLCQLCYDR